MTGKIYVKAAKGLVLRDPRSKEPLPAAGGWVEDTTFWRRRLLHGDCKEVKPPKPGPDSRAKAEAADKGKGKAPAKTPDSTPTKE